MIDISIVARKARDQRDPFSPLEFGDPGPPKLAGTAVLSDKQASFLGAWVFKHLAARQRNDFRLAVLSRLSAGTPGGAAFQRAVVLTALEFGYERSQLESVGLVYVQERSNFGNTRRARSRARARSKITYFWRNDKMGLRWQTK
jgi:hypothetical protein